jgi:hypothetical protein
MIRTAPFEAHEYLADDAAQIAALTDAYESKHAGVIDGILASVIRARAASGIETEGQDGETRLGAKHESPTAAQAAGTPDTTNTVGQGEEI